MMKPSMDGKAKAGKAVETENLGLNRADYRLPALGSREVF